MVPPDFPKIALAVLFQEGSSAKDYAYTIRVNSTNYNSPEAEGRPAQLTTPNTEREFASYAKKDDVCAPVGGTAQQGPFQDSCTGQYMYNGALTIQRLVGDWVMADSGAANAGYTVAEHGVQFLPFPTKYYVENGFYATIAPFAPLLVILGLMYPVAAIIRSITMEKELRQKELMKMMSVTESDIGWSWFLSYFIFHLFTTVAMAGATSALYSNSDFVFLFIFWFLTFISAVTVFGFFIASFITKSTRGVLVGLLLFFIGYFLPIAADIDTGSLALIQVISLHPVAAFSYGMVDIGRLEDAGTGLTSSTFNQTDSPSGYTFATTIRMLAFDAILWSVVAWYLNRVVPSVQDGSFQIFSNLPMAQVRERLGFTSPSDCFRFSVNECLSVLHVMDTCGLVANKEFTSLWSFPTEDYATAKEWWDEHGSNPQIKTGNAVVHKLRTRVCNYVAWKGPEPPLTLDESSSKAEIKAAYNYLGGLLQGAEEEDPLDLEDDEAPLADAAVGIDDAAGDGDESAAGDGDESLLLETATKLPQATATRELLFAGFGDEIV